MSRNPDEFAAWLLAQPISRYAIAMELGIPKQHPYQWQSGERSPTPEQITELSEMFNTDPDAIYAMLGKIPTDIEHSLRHANPDIFRAVRIIVQ